MMLWPKNKTGHCISVSFITDVISEAEVNDQTNPENEKPELRGCHREKAMTMQRSSVHWETLLPSIYHNAVSMALLKHTLLLLFLSKYTEVLVNSCILNTKWWLLNPCNRTAATLCTYQSYNLHEDNCNRMLNRFSYGLRVLRETPKCWV